MKDRVFRKVDPRLIRALRSTEPKADGVIGAAFSAPSPGSTDPDDIEILVAVTGDKPPQGFGNRWYHIAGGIYTVLLNRQLVDKLADAREVISIEYPRLLKAASELAVAIAGHPLHRPPLSRTGRGVVVGIIDFDIDYTLDDFKTPDGKSTRIKWLWDQSLPRERGENVPHFGYGVEYNEADINRALANSNPYSVVRHRALRNHGTRVAGIAVSNARDAVDPHAYLGMAPDADVIFVSLGLTRGAVSNSGSQHTTSVPRVVQALNYIFEKVAEMPVQDGTPPCVINLSITQTASSHDGESLMETPIDALLDRGGRAVVIAAGNDAEADCHAEWQYGPGQSTDLTIDVPHFSRGTSSCELEIWYSSRDSISVSIYSPDGQVSKVIQAPFSENEQLGETTVYVLSTRFEERGGDGRIYLSFGQNYTPVTEGKWTLRLDASPTSHTGMLHAWIETTARTPARFVGAEKRMTIGTPATARRSISVGNLNADRTVHGGSGRGRTRDGRDKPDIVAPGTDVVTCNPGHAQRVVGTGTSFSAPYITGLIACLFEEHPELTPAQIRRVLIAASDGNAFDEGAGFGSVDAQKALDLIREYL
jgi:subtilisin family serine protease